VNLWEELSAAVNVPDVFTTGRGDPALAR